MAFRYLIYRTDFGNTIVRENPTNNSTGGTEQSLFSDFVIPEIQPLYLWRITGGTDVVPNTDQNINNWLDHITPISPDDSINYNIFTGYTAQTQTDIDTKVSFTIFSGYTAQTQTDLDNKINIVTGATGNVGEFDVSGNLIDSGYSVADLTGSTPIDIYVSGGTLNNTVLELQRTEGESDVAIELSGLTNNNITKNEFTGYTATTNSRITNIEGDIITISGDVIQNTTNIQIVSGQTDINTSNIVILSATTANKQDILSGGAGINSNQLTNNDIIELDLNAYTAVGDVNITVTGGTNAVFTDLRILAKGLEYGGDYSTNFTVRSLVDKGYVDAIGSGLDLKESVRVVTTTNIDLTLGTFGGSIDGITIQDGWRILVKDQTNKIDNGIYIYSSGVNTFARANDFDNPNVTAGAFTFTETGTTYGGSGWVLLAIDPVNIGVDELNFTQFSEAGVLTAGVGIDITSGVITFDGANVAGESISWSGTQLNIDISTGNTLGDALANKLETSVFISYSAITDTRITNIENTLATVTADTGQLRIDIDAVSAKTDQNIIDILAISAETTQNTIDITNISGITDTKLDTIIFTGYTASTQSNELFLIHTGGTNLNSIIATPILWDSSVIIDSAYSWTGGSQIIINDTGDYEINYNIPFNQSGNNTDKSIGTNLILNNATTIDNATSAGWTSRNNAAGTINLPTILITLTAGDSLDLVGFRTARSGSAITSPNGSILIKKKDKLQ